MWMPSWKLEGKIKQVKGKQRNAKAKKYLPIKLGLLFDVWNKQYQLFLADH